MIENILASPDIVPDSVIDVQNLKSPLPLFHTKKKLEKMEKEQILHIKTSDASSRNDFFRWCKNARHEYMGERKTGNIFNFYIKN